MRGRRKVLMRSPSRFDRMAEGRRRVKPIAQVKRFSLFTSRCLVQWSRKASAPRCTAMLRHFSRARPCRPGTAVKPAPRLTQRLAERGIHSRFESCASCKSLGMRTTVPAGARLPTLTHLAPRAASREMLGDAAGAAMNNGTPSAQLAVFAGQLIKPRAGKGLPCPDPQHIAANSINLNLYSQKRAPQLGKNVSL